MTKKHSTKIIAIALAVAMLLAMQAVAFANDSPDNVTLTVNVPETYPGVGGTFPITVTITGNPGIAAVQFTLVSDSSVECISADIGTALSGAMAASNPSADVGAIIAAASATNLREDGEIGVFVYKMLSDNTPKFSLSEIVLSNEDIENVSYTTAFGVQASGSIPLKGTTGDGLGITSVQKPNPEPGQITTSSALFFSDVPTDHWAASYIGKAAEAGLFKGYADGRFGLVDNVTRVQFITVLWRYAGSQTSTATAVFTDMDTTVETDYAKAVRWGYETGYIAGYTNADGTYSFNPDGTITRQDAMTILFRFDGSTIGLESMLSGTYDQQFKDSESIADYAKSAVYWSVYKGYISGIGESMLSPGGLATRGQLAKILVEYMESKRV